MQIAFSVFNITPDTFWKLTTHEWFAYIEGYNNLHKSNTPAKETAGTDDISFLRKNKRTDGQALKDQTSSSQSLTQMFGITG